MNALPSPQFIYYGALQKRRAMQRQLLESRSYHKRHRLRGHSSATSTTGGHHQHHKGPSPDLSLTAAPDSDVQHAACEGQPHQHHHHHHHHHHQHGAGCSDPAGQQQQQHRPGEEISILVAMSEPVEAEAAVGGRARGGASAGPAIAAAGVVASMLAVVAYGTLQLHEQQGRPSLGLAHMTGRDAGRWPLEAGGTGGQPNTLALGLTPGCDPNIEEGAVLPWWCDASSIQLVAGTALGYISTVMYLSSRVSQIAKNAARKSAEGLSLIMFLMTVTANCCTGCSILLRLAGLEALRQQLPWLAGAFGTVGLDLTIAWQARKYQRAAAHSREEAALETAALETPLLIEG